MHDVSHDIGTKDPAANLLRTYAEHILVVVFGLLPIFFIPISSVPFEYTKILFVSAGVFCALVLYSLSALRRGGLSVGFSVTICAAWVLVLVGTVSAMLSGDVRDALIGDTFTTQVTAFLVLLALIMSVWTIIDGSKRAIIRLFMLLAGSTIVLVVYHALRLIFGAETLSFSLFTSATASPVGGWNDLALFLGLSVILALVALEQLALTRVGKGLFGLVVLLSLVMLTVINFFTVWLVLGFTSLTIIVYTLTRDRMSGNQLPLVARRSFNTISLAGSLVVFVISALFIIGGSALGGMLSSWTGISYVEVRPSFGATLDIARGVYEQNTFLGIGPNRFSDAWRVYKDPAINTTVFWSTDFNAGNGYVSTFLVTTGVLGILAWLVFIGAFVVSGVRMLMSGSDQDRVWYFIGLSAFVGGLYIWGMSLVYVPGAVILMLGALCVGITVTADRALRSRERRMLSLVTDRRTGFIFTLIVIAIIIGSVSSMYAMGRHYASVVSFVEGERARERGEFGVAETQYAKAYALNQSDVYVRRIGELRLNRLTAIMGIEVPTQADQIEFRDVIQAGIAAGEEARTKDPTEAENWSLLGNLYSVLIGLNIDGVYEKSREALIRAKELNPQNPLAPLNLGVLEGRMGNYESARSYTEESIRLRPNFTDAFYYLSQIDVVTGNVEGALGTTLSMITLEPNNPVRYYQLGILEAARNNLLNAIAAFERALTLDTNYANARYMLALAYEEVERTADALVQLEKVLELNPGNVEVEARIRALKSGTTTPEVSKDVPSVSTIEEQPSVQDEDGTVTTQEDPDTNLVSPVNTVPDTTTP